MFKDKYGDTWQSEEVYNEYKTLVEKEKPNLEKANIAYKKYYEKLKLNKNER